MAATTQTATSGGEGMKCPIRYNVWVDTNNKPILLDQDCLKEECALWQSQWKLCDIHSISYDLDRIADALEFIREALRK